MQTFSIFALVALLFVSTIACTPTQVASAVDQIQTYLASAQQDTSVLETVATELKTTLDPTSTQARQLQLAYTQTRSLAEAYTVALENNLAAGTLPNDLSDLAADAQQAKIQFLTAAMPIMAPNTETRAFPVAAILAALPLHMLLDKLPVPWRKKTFDRVRPAVTLRSWGEL